MLFEQFNDTLATAVSASTLYDGSGTGNALQEAANETDLAALGTAPTDIVLEAPSNAIRIWLVSATADKSGTLCVGQFDSDGDLLEVVESTISATDQVFDTDRDAWSLTTGTDIPAKTPIEVAYRRHAATATLQLWMANANSATWYARYQLLGSV